MTKYRSLAAIFLRRNLVPRVLSLLRESRESTLGTRLSQTSVRERDHDVRAIVNFHKSERIRMYNILRCVFEPGRGGAGGYSLIRAFNALKTFVSGIDVLLHLPTGFGKSLVFQMAP